MIEENRGGFQNPAGGQPPTGLSAARGLATRRRPPRAVFYGYREGAGEHQGGHLAESFSSLIMESTPTNDG
jgi:hypothetical protein